MGYVRTAGMSTAARRSRRRAALVILSLLVGLLAAFAIAVATMQGWITFGGDGDTDEVTVTSEAPEVALAPEDIVVNVLNSTDTAGLAGRAAEALRTRGYAVDQVGNDPGDIEGVGVIRHGPEGLRAAQALQEALPDGVTLAADETEGDAVTLVLGDEWTDLPDAEDAGSTEEG